MSDLQKDLELVRRMAKKISQYDKEIKSLQLEIDKCSSNLKKLRDSRRKKEKLIENIKSSHKEIYETFIEVEKSIDTIQGSIIRLIMHGEISPYEKDSFYNKHLEDINSSLSNLRTKMDDKLKSREKEELDLSNIVASIRQKSNLIKDLSSKIASLKLEISSVNSEIDKVTRRVSGVEPIFCSSGNRSWMRVRYRIIRPKRESIYQDIKEYMRVEEGDEITWYRLREPSSRKDKKITSKKTLEELNKLYNEY